MHSNLPPSLQKIHDRDRDRDKTTKAPVTHLVVFGTPTSDLMDIVSQGPIHLPAVGERIKLHRVPVRVISVETEYEMDSEDQPSVYTKVFIEAVEDE